MVGFLSSSMWGGCFYKWDLTHFGTVVPFLDIKTDPFKCGCYNLQLPKLGHKMKMELQAYTNSKVVHTMYFPYKVTLYKPQGNMDFKVFLCVPDTILHLIR